MANKVDKILAGMRKSGKLSDWKAKGSAGEEAALAVCLGVQQKIGGVIYHSFKYPYQKDTSGKTCTGNIKLENGKYVEYTERTRGTLSDEIDILWVNAYRIFPIEVKAYHATIEVYDHWVKKNKCEVEKSPILQAEKHARHLYHALYDVLPCGDAKYIVPLTCFVDRCKVIDTRSESFIQYIPLCILNNLKDTLYENNIPLKYNIDVEAVKRKLSSVQTECLKIYV